MKVENVMVTGANRGIGLEFVRQLIRLSEPPKYIFATYRRPDSLKNLEELKESSTKTKIHLIKMDITISEERDAAKSMIEEIVKEKGLNLLINNAGVAESEAFPHLTSKSLEMQFKVNTIGSIMVLQTMFPLLEKAANLYNGTESLIVTRAAVLNITSSIGSITNTGVIFRRDLVIPAYKMSKAALNMGMRVIAANVKNKGILVIMMCPGWVKTDMGTDSAILEPEDSIRDMINTLLVLNESHHGTFIDRKGTPIPY